MDVLREYHNNPNGARQSLENMAANNYAFNGPGGPGFGTTVAKLDKLVPALLIGKAATREFKFSFTGIIPRLNSLKDATNPIRNDRYQVAVLAAANVEYCSNALRGQSQIQNMSQYMDYHARDSLDKLKQSLRKDGVWSVGYIEDRCKEENRDVRKEDVLGVFYPVALLMDTLLKDSEWRDIMPTPGNKLLRITEAELARFGTNPRLGLLDNNLLKPTPTHV